MENKADVIDSARILTKLGVKIYCTSGTAKFMKQVGIDSQVLHWPLEKKTPNVIDHVRSGKVDLVINIPKNFQEKELTNDYLIRRNAVDFGVPLITNLQLARRFVEAVAKRGLSGLEIRSWEEYVEG